MLPRTPLHDSARSTEVSLLLSLAIWMVPVLSP